MCDNCAVDSTTLLRPPIYRPTTAPVAGQVPSCLPPRYLPATIFVPSYYDHVITTWVTTLHLPPYVLPSYHPCCSQLPSATTHVPSRLAYLYLPVTNPRASVTILRLPLLQSCGCHPRYHHVPPRCHPEYQPATTPGITEVPSRLPLRWCKMKGTVVLHFHFYTTCSHPIWAMVSQSTKL